MKAVVMQAAETAMDPRLLTAPSLCVDRVVAGELGVPPPGSAPVEDRLCRRGAGRRLPVLRFRAAPRARARVAGASGGRLMAGGVGVQPIRVLVTDDHCVPRTGVCALIDRGPSAHRLRQTRHARLAAGGDSGLSRTRSAITRVCGNPAADRASPRCSRCRDRRSCGHAYRLPPRNP
jgi:hypothetical protein